VTEGEQTAIELLKSVALFADLEGEELERFSHVAVPRSFPAGTRVFHEGDSSDACYIVKEGSFRVTREHSDGRAITLATLGPGEIFGELAMLDGDSRSASAEALTDGELLALPANDVRSLLARHPEIALKLVAGLVRRLRADNVRLIKQSFQTVPSRDPGILAQLAGTSRESVSRFLAELERAGVVRSGRGRVTVLDPPKLRNYIY
jgi:CRP/FNR family transcriptional regulator